MTAGTAKDRNWLDGNGGWGSGGSAQLNIYGGATIGGALDLSADATGGDGEFGGQAFNSSAEVFVNVDSGTLTVTGSSLLSVNGVGGAGTDYGANASAGLVKIQAINNSTATINNLKVEANATGGDGTDGGGGEASAGTVSIVVAKSSGSGDLSTLTLTGTATVDANATGGDGGTFGGDAYGGNDIGIYANEGGTLNFDRRTLNANATAGAGETRGYSEGGYVFVQSQGGNIIGNSLAMSANGQDGGGFMEVLINGSTDPYGGPGSISVATFDAEALGGAEYGGASQSPPSAAAPSIWAKPASSRPAAAPTSISMPARPAAPTPPLLPTACRSRPTARWISTRAEAASSTLPAISMSSALGAVTVSANDGTGRVEANNITMSGSDLYIDNLTGNTSIDLTAGNTAYFYGMTQAPTITVTSFDIFTGDFASLGVYGITDLLTLNAVNSNGVYIGDFGEAVLGSVYYDEGDGDVQAANVVINALASDEGGVPDVHIGDIEIEGTDVGDVQAGDGPSTASHIPWGTASVTVNTDSVDPR